MEPGSSSLMQLSGLKTLAIFATRIPFSVSLCCQLRRWPNAIQLLAFDESQLFICLNTRYANLKLDADLVKRLISMHN